MLAMLTQFDVPAYETDRKERRLILFLLAGPNLSWPSWLTVLYAAFMQCSAI